MDNNVMKNALDRFMRELDIEATKKTAKAKKLRAMLEEFRKEKLRNQK